MASEFKIPRLGEDVESATVAGILVSVGDTIEEEQSVIELETDKAAMEIPADTAGTVQEIHVKEGEEVTVGQLVLTLGDAAEGDGEGASDAQNETGDDGRNETAQEKSAFAEETPDDQDQQQEKASPASPGAAGGKETGGGHDEEEAEAGQSQEEPENERPAPDEEAPPEGEQQAPDAAPPAPAAAGEEETKTGPPVPAAPSVRRFAREIGVDIERVAGSGPEGRISVDDVKACARRGGVQQADAPALPDFSRWGPVRREPMNRVRRVTAARVAQSWSTVPHVTQFGRADIAEIEKLRKQHGPAAEEAGGRLSITAILVKVAEAALKEFPGFNASLDPETDEIIYKEYYHVGVAVDTDRGLVVPVIRDVDRKNIVEIAADLRRLADAARDGTLAAEDMQGGTFTVTNLGSLGGGPFTPVVNWPEAAILGVAAAETAPVYRDGAFRAGQLLPLALSYDHRLVDGADGARFMNRIVETLEDPVTLLWTG